jgi:hypothetical protein
VTNPSVKRQHEIATSQNDSRFGMPVGVSGAYGFAGDRRAKIISDAGIEVIGANAPDKGIPGDAGG